MAETRQKATFNLVDKPEFPSTHDGMIITGGDLSKHVNAIMTRIFADFAGCKILVDQGSTGVDGTPIVMNPNHPVQLELYFNLGNRVEGERRLYAFRPITDTIKNAVGERNKKSYVAMALGHNIAITQNKSSEITEDGIDILGDMLWYEVATRMSKNPTAKEFNKKGIVVEASTASGISDASFPNFNSITRSTSPLIIVDQRLTAPFLIAAAVLMVAAAPLREPVSAQSRLPAPCDASNRFELPVVFVNESATSPVKRLSDEATIAKIKA